jgi:hypothetical protein
MKRVLCVILSLIILFGISGCAGRKTEPPQQSGGSSGSQEQGSKEKLDKNEGKRVAEGYMQALILRDENKIKSFYSTNLRQQSGTFSPTENPHPNGYMVESFDDKDGKLEGKARIFSIITGSPYFSSDESTITIVKEKGTYVIDKIEKSKSVEVTEKDKTLTMKEGGDVKGKEIVKLDELTQFAVPQGSTPNQKLPVGRDKFGPIALDTEGKKLAFAAIGTNPTLMIADIEGKKASPLDLYTEGSVLSIAWSQDGKTLVVEMSGRGGGRFLNIYDVEKGKKINDPMKAAFSSDIYNISMPYWIADNELVFNVSGVSRLNPDQQKQTGSYKFDVKNLSLTKF